MAISYNLVMSNRRRYPISYVCFGLLNKFAGITSNHFNCNSSFYKGIDYHRTFTPESANLVAVEYDYVCDARRYLSEGAALDQFLDDYRREVRKFLRAFPWIKPVAVHNKKLGVVRVRAKGVPADKLMFILMSVRNILDRQRDIRDWDTYRKEMMEGCLNRIPSYAAQWVYTNLNWFVHRRDWSNPSNSFWEAHPKFNDESNVLNSATFGKRSLKRLLSGEEPEWFQEHFENTYNGYLRDSHFEEEGETFSNGAPLDDVDEYYADELSEYCSQSPLYRTMADSLSVEFDEPIFSNCDYDDYVGFTYDGRQLLQENLDEYLKALEEL